MFSSFIVTFREVLEMALIVGVVLAATVGLPGRMRWILGGMAAGVLGSCVVAFFTESISNFAHGVGQELFNAMILFTASLIIGWTAIWMKTHARTMVKKIKEQGVKIVDGELPKITLSLIIGLAVLREGAEIVLFTYGMLASGQAVHEVLSGCALGLAVGALIGFGIYKGLVAIPTKYIFQVTTWLLLLLTAGMSSMGAKYLVAAGYFDTMSSTVADFSAILSEKSTFGKIMQVLFGYSERPMEIQVVFYLVTLLGSVALMFYLDKLHNAKIRNNKV